MTPMKNADVTDNSPELRTLVIGCGKSAEIAAKAFLDSGLFVTLGSTNDNGLRISAKADPSNLNYIGVGDFPRIARTKKGFSIFCDDEEQQYDFLVVAPEVELVAKSAWLSDNVELFGYDFYLEKPDTIAFLLDYGTATHTVLALKAVSDAMENCLKEGKSYVFFQQFPLVHPWAEELYDKARNAGVHFIRFAEIQPKVIATESGFTLQARTTDSDPMEFVCRRVVQVTGPNPTGVPAWARKLAKYDVDRSGFLLSESVHRHSGKSSCTNIYFVGPVTGVQGELHCEMQAKAAAVNARSRLLDAVSHEHRNVEIGTQCVGCLTCRRICPHDAFPTEISSFRSSGGPNQFLCQNCGICASSCPAGAIQFFSQPEDELLANLKGLEGKIYAGTVVFGCQKSAGILAEHTQIPENILFLPVPCAGRVSEYLLWKTFTLGAKNVAVIGCHPGNCHSDIGSTLAKARVHRGLQTEIFHTNDHRLSYFSIAANERARFDRLLRDITK